MFHWIITRDDGTRLTIVPRLRFVIREGKKVLQQLHLEHNASSLLDKARKQHWIDVPVIEDEQGGE